MWHLWHHAHSSNQQKDDPLFDHGVCQPYACRFGVEGCRRARRASRHGLCLARACGLSGLLMAFLHRRHPRGFSLHLCHTRACLGTPCAMKWVGIFAAFKVKQSWIRFWISLYTVPQSGLRRAIYRSRLEAQVLLFTGFDKNSEV